jgi:phage FluMu protein Com
VSSSATYAGNLAGWPLLDTFIIATACQLVLGFIMSSVKSAIVTTKMKQLQVDEVEAFSKQGLDLKCAHCGNASFVPIRLDEHNTYACPHCTKTNSIYIKVTIARETTMINSPSITTSSVSDGESITMEGSK